jgi:hypothetical protein
MGRLFIWRPAGIWTHEAETFERAGCSGLQVRAVTPQPGLGNFRTMDNGDDAEMSILRV